MESALIRITINKCDMVTKVLQLQDTMLYEAMPWHSDDHVLTREMTTNAVCKLIYDVSD